MAVIGEDWNYRKVVPHANLNPITSELQIIKNQLADRHNTEFFINVGGTLNLRIIATDPIKRAVFIGQIVELVKAMDADGVVVGWENKPSKGYADIDKQDYEQFFIELSHALTDLGRQTKIAISPGIHSRDIERMKLVSPYVDMIMPQFYGAVSKNENGELQHYPMKKVRKKLEQILAAGIPKSKLVMGTAVFGKSRRAGALLNVGVRQLMENTPNPTPELNNLLYTAKTKSSDNKPRSFRYYFHSKNELEARVKYVEDHGLRGIMLIDAGYHDFYITDERSVVKIVNEAFSN